MKLLPILALFYKAAYNLKFNNSLDLIDAKNAMEQAIEPYQELAIACASPLANAINLKEIVNLMNCQSRNFSQLNPACSTFSSLSLPSSNFKKVYTVDKETCKKFGSLIERRVECFNCNNIGHFKANCPSPKKKYFSRNIQHLLGN